MRQEIVYPDDRVLIAIVNNRKDWETIYREQWYRIPAKKAPAAVPHIDWLAFYFTAAFGSDKWAVHYFAPILGHELLTRAELLPSEPNHPRAGQWYFKLNIGAPQHKLPPIVAENWRRVTFIFTTGDRFEHARTLSDLLSDTAPDGRPFVTLKECPQAYHVSTGG